MFFALAHLDCDMPEMLQFGPEVGCTHLKENILASVLVLAKGSENEKVFISISLVIAATCSLRQLNVTVANI